MIVGDPDDRQDRGGRYEGYLYSESGTGTRSEELLWDMGYIMRSSKYMYKLCHPILYFGEERRVFLLSQLSMNIQNDLEIGVFPQSVQYVHCTVRKYCSLFM